PSPQTSNLNHHIIHHLASIIYKTPPILPASHSLTLKCSHSQTCQPELVAALLHSRKSLTIFNPVTIHTMTIHKILLIGSILLSAVIQSQETKKLKKPTDTPYLKTDTIPKVVKEQPWELNKPILILDNHPVPYETILTLQSDKIESVKIEKQANQAESVDKKSTLIINMKPVPKTILIPVTALISKYTEIKDGKYIVSIDGEPVNLQQDQLLVDEKNIMQIRITKLDQLGLAPNLYQVRLLTRNNKNLQKANTIIIR
ncbi:hypothetical protein SAMN05660493_00859, partial [Epilithonimonas bovis DSM 19482]